MKIPELLAPAGNFEKLRIALHYGADSIYMGLSDFSLRAKADNFSLEKLREAVKIIHEKNKKAYITINIIPHNRDIIPIKEHLLIIKDMLPDGIIISDIGVFEIAHSVIPDIPIHISTQANVTNYRSAKLWEKMGARRIVLSRELTIDEIKEIRDQVSIELECFVHGAICISYSGRCYISSFIANRSANKGECANSCRWNYTLMEEKRRGEYYPVYENDRGTYVMSSRDLCMIEHLDKLADAGIDCFKIEGRMKGINYVAGVVKTYREAIDGLINKPFIVKEQWLHELSMFSSRGFTTGMFLKKHPDTDYNHDDPEIYRMSHELVGVVTSIRKDKAVVSLRNSLKIGDSIEYLSQGIHNEQIDITEMYDESGIPIASGRNEEIIMLPVKQGVRVNDLIRRPLDHSLNNIEIF